MSGGSIRGNEHIHSFNNLIPACEFAVSIAKEGHTGVSLKTDLAGALDLSEAKRIVEVWESGKVSLDAEEIVF